MYYPRYKQIVEKLSPEDQAVLNGVMSYCVKNMTCMAVNEFTVEDKVVECCKACHKAEDACKKDADCGACCSKKKCAEASEDDESSCSSESCDGCC